VVKQKVLIGISLCSLLVLAGCVSEQSYVGSDKPVSDRSFDNIEAARTRISLGLNYLRRGDTSQAKYNLERARSFAPNSAEVHSALAYYYQSVGEHKQAEEYFKLAIQKDSNYADAYNNYGAFLCQLQRYDEAEQLLLKAISRPGYIRVAESYENLALCQLQQNKFNKAKGYLDNSISHNTTRITSLTMAAGLAYAMGDNRQAKSHLDRIQRLGRVSARTVLLSYLIAEKNGDRDTMRSAEQLLLTLYTETPETRLLLQGKLDENEFEQLRQRYKDSLMANIVLPDDNAERAETPTKPVANPKLKVVKRKTADEDSADAVKSAPQERLQRKPAAELNNTASAIVNSLALSKTVITKPATVAAALPVETIAVEKTQAKTTQAETTPVATTPVQKVAVQEQSTLAKPAVQQAQTSTASTTSARVAVQQPEPEQSAEPAKLAAVLPQAEPGQPVAAVTDHSAVDVSGAASTPFHIVQPAESLYAISVRHNIRLPSLMSWNRMTPDSVIKTGQKIWLGPVSEAELVEPVVTHRPQVAVTQPVHIVAEGETIFAISYRYNVRLNSFMSWNNLTESSKLKVGQQVYVIDPASIEP
jgi:type IV pilus assembly protein PilF